MVCDPGASCAYLGKILSFWKILDQNIKKLKEIFDLNFHLIAAIVIKAWQLEIKNYDFVSQMFCIS
jgi:hypothetical protein